MTKFKYTAIAAAVALLVPAAAFARSDNTGVSKQAQQAIIVPASPGTSQFSDAGNQSSDSQSPSYTQDGGIAYKVPPVNASNGAEIPTGG